MEMGMKIFVAVAMLCSLAAPSLQQNLRMNESCTPANMPSMDNLDLDKLSGRWYMSHVSTNGVPNAHYLVRSVVRDITQAMPLTSDKAGNPAEFMVVKQTNLLGSQYLQWCQNSPALFWMCEDFPGSRCVSNYHATYHHQRDVSEPKFPEGYYISYHEETVLATDYNTTSVSYAQYVVNSYSNIIFGEFQIHVRTPTTTPSQAVIDQAFKTTDFCTGNFLDVDSDFYYKYDNTVAYLDCFTKPYDPANYSGHSPR